MNRIDLLCVAIGVSIIALEVSAQANKQEVARFEAEIYVDGDSARESGAPLEAGAKTDAPAERSLGPTPRHELSHVVQQRQGRDGGGADATGVAPQQGRVALDADPNEARSADRRTTRPSLSEIRDGTSNTILVGENSPATPRLPAMPAPQLPAGSPVPEVEDEVLTALQSGDYQVSGEYFVVSTRHRVPVRLPAGTYRTRGGTTFTVRNGRLVAVE
jgi:hypothetical protein